MTPWGTIPVLDYQGLVIGQSTAASRLTRTETVELQESRQRDFVLERFLAKEFGFAGKNNAEQAQADEIVDVIVDLIDEQVFFLFRCFMFIVLCRIWYRKSNQ